MAHKWTPGNWGCFHKDVFCFDLGLVDCRAKVTVLLFPAPLPAHNISTCLHRKNLKLQWPKPERQDISPLGIVGFLDKGHNVICGDTDHDHVTDHHKIIQHPEPTIGANQEIQVG